MIRPPHSLPPGSRGRGRRSAVALGVAPVAVAVAVAGCGAGSTAASSPAAAASSPHLPAQLLGLSKNTGSQARSLGRALSAVFATFSSVYRGPQAAVYGDIRGPTIVVLTAGWSSKAAHRAASAAFDKRSALGAFAGTGRTDAHSFPAGPRGGALYCGHVTRTGTPLLVCWWADKVSSGGVIYFLGSASSVSAAAAKTNQVRSAIAP
jgi:hypothetical protein